MSGAVLFQPPGSSNPEVRNSYIKYATNFLTSGTHIKDLTPTTPMSVERLITAQMNYYANNDQNVRSRTLFNATPIGIGWLLTLTARIIRIAFRTLGMPLSLAVAAFQQARYGEMKEKNEPILKYNLVREDIKRIGQEYCDLGTTLLSSLIGTVNTVSPEAISTEFLYNYYYTRVKLNEERNDQYYASKQAYLDIEKQKHEDWKNAQATPVTEF
jgi:hypothetical protein